MDGGICRFGSKEAGFQPFSLIEGPPLMASPSSPNCLSLTTLNQLSCFFLQRVCKVQVASSFSSLSGKIRAFSSSHMSGWESYRWPPHHLGESKNTSMRNLSQMIHTITNTSFQGGQLYFPNACICATGWWLRFLAEAHPAAQKLKALVICRTFPSPS